MRAHTLIVLTSTFFAGAACSTTTPIGEVEKAGASGSVPTGAAGMTGAAGTTAGPQGGYVPSPSAALNDQPFTNPSDLSGDWVGYFENYDRGSDAVRFHFGVDAQGHGTISVKLGDGTPPPPPTAANDAWPVPVVYPQGSPGPGIGYPGSPIDGFTYTAHEVTWQGRRLKFHLSSAEPWTIWCGLQTSYPLPGTDLYSCNGGNGANCGGSGPDACRFVDGTQGTTDRNHLMMCTVTSGFCDCNPTGCGPTSGGMSFDLTFYADHAYGSGSSYNVQLMPVAP